MIPQVSELEDYEDKIEVSPIAYLNSQQEPEEYFEGDGEENVKEEI